MPGYGWCRSCSAHTHPGTQPSAKWEPARAITGWNGGRTSGQRHQTEVPIIPEFLESEEFVVSEFIEAPAPARRTARASKPAAVSQDFAVPAAAGREKSRG